MRVTSKTRKRLADIRKMCIGRVRCDDCPFWDNELKCRLIYHPYEWLIEDWKECKEE